MASAISSIRACRVNADENAFWAVVYVRLAFCLKAVLQPGELLRSIYFPASALTKRFAFRRSSLTHLGRSAALLAGTQSQGGGNLVFTVTASTARPIQLRFDRMPSAEELRHAIGATIKDADWFGDVHGSAPYKRHLTYYYAEQIRTELASK